MLERVLKFQRKSGIARPLGISKQEPEDRCHEERRYLKFYADGGEGGVGVYEGHTKQEAGGVGFRMPVPAILW